MEGRNSHQILSKGIHLDTSLCSSQSEVAISLSREDILAVYEESPEAVYFRRSKFDPLFKLTYHPVNKVHVSLPSPKTLSVHIQDYCMMGNPIENCSCKGSIMEYLHPVRESQIGSNDSTHRLVSRCQQLKKQFCAGEIECDIPEFIED